jgi:hypothetical protein
VNNPALRDFCNTTIGRADIEESKSNVAMNPCWGYCIATPGRLVGQIPDGGKNAIFLLLAKDSTIPEVIELTNEMGEHSSAK